MPKPTRCLVAAVFLAAVAHAQSTSGSSENIQTYGLGAILTYVISKDLGPLLIHRIKGGNAKRGMADLDKADAVMVEKVGNLVKSFDEHVIEDRTNFADMREKQSEIANGVARIEGMLQRRS